MSVTECTLPDRSGTGALSRETEDKEKVPVISVNSNNSHFPSSVIYMGDRVSPYGDELRIAVTNGR